MGDILATKSFKLKKFSKRFGILGCLEENIAKTLGQWRVLQPHTYGNPLRFGNRQAASFLLKRTTADT